MDPTDMLAACLVPTSVAGIPLRTIWTGRNFYHSYSFLPPPAIPNHLLRFFVVGFDFIIPNLPVRLGLDGFDYCQALPLMTPMLPVVCQLLDFPAPPLRGKATPDPACLCRALPLPPHPPDSFCPEEHHAFPVSPHPAVTTLLRLWQGRAGLPPCGW